MKKCTLGPRHKWNFKKNVDVTTGSISATSSRLSFSKKGLYTCECGARKYGEYQHQVKEPQQ
ncbi:hypothetical protein [Acinetobacter guillouiae]|uniref:hypothetical protein n=2 Tax=Acinetobacter TaxID=469 RepID=UPI0028EA2EFB|nr:hypothetical protein [Acinetobacter guillouiae]